MVQMAFCDMSHTFHKQVTNVCQHVFVIILHITSTQLTFLKGWRRYVQHKNSCFLTIMKQLNQKLESESTQNWQFSQICINVWTRKCLRAHYLINCQLYLLRSRIYIKCHVYFCREVLLKLYLPRPKFYLPRSGGQCMRLSLVFIEK